ncbi:MAG: hypothetical protein J6S67_12145 [Methanobrevibacter sp.]|nr:hypothetical protein [Methanobrevibacter sp.]
MDRLISENLLLRLFDGKVEQELPLFSKTMTKIIKRLPSAYKGMTNGEVITKILKDAEWAELTSDIGLAQEDTIYIKVGSYWWNSPYNPQERSDKE